MAKNYMADVARMLGVELGEQFRLRRIIDQKCLKDTYVFDENGFWGKTKGRKRYYNVQSTVWQFLLTGDYEVVKLPWQPKTNEAYYRPAYKFFGVTSEVWTDDPYDYAFKEAGMIFRTAEECAVALPELRKKYLGGGCNETDD